MKHNSLPLGAPATHFWLTQASARALGVNLSDALAEGRLTAGDYAGMVTACRRCPHVVACQQWLATEAVPQRAVFEGCPNRARLAALR